MVDTRTDTDLLLDVKESMDPMVDLENGISGAIEGLEVGDPIKEELVDFFKKVLSLPDEGLKEPDDYLLAVKEAVKDVKADDMSELTQNVRKVLGELGVDLGEVDADGDLAGVSEEEKELKLREMVEGLVKSMIPEVTREKMGEVMGEVGEFVKNIDWKKVGKWLVIAAIAIVIFIVVVLPLLKLAAMGYGAATAMQQQR